MVYANVNERKANKIKRYNLFSLEGRQMKIPFNTARKKNQKLEKSPNIPEVTELNSF